MALPIWVRLPTQWIEAGGLKQYSWATTGVEGLAALMCLWVVAHHADQETGMARLTYDDFHTATGLSRTTISGGLGILEERNVERLGQSIYKLRDFEPNRFGMIPAKRLYNAKGEVIFFKELSRRKAVELNAMRFYLLMVARRDRKTNHAHITYDSIQEYTGMSRDEIMKARTFLASTSMVYTEHLRSAIDYRTSSAYRLAHLDSYHHLGTNGRDMEAAGVFNAEAQ